MGLNSNTRKLLVHFNVQGKEIFSDVPFYQRPPSSYRGRKETCRVPTNPHGVGRLAMPTSE